MAKVSYDRYGLTANPFRDLASESLEDVEIFHVRLQVDDVLRGVKEEVLEKENRAVIAITGPLGSGKTQRLRLAEAEGKERGAFTALVDVPARSKLAVKAIADALSKASNVGGFSAALGGPAWLRELHGVAAGKSGEWDAGRAGKAIAQALNEHAPAFLLLNDLHNLAPAAEVQPIARVLQAVADAIRPGVLVMFACYPSFFAALTQAYPALGSRINRTLELPVISDDEAGLLLAKKLLAKRLVEEMDPLYPFDREAVEAMNQAAGGNPRRLLETADRVMEAAVAQRVYRIDGPFARATLESLAPPAPAVRPVVPTAPGSGGPGAARAPPPVAVVAAAPLRPVVPKDP